MKMKLYKGHTRKLTFYLKKDGAAFDVTGATIVINMEPADGGANQITDGACVLEDAANGEISYTPNADDFNTVDLFKAQFKITIGAKDEYSDTFEVDVLEVI